MILDAHDAAARGWRKNHEPLAIKTTRGKRNEISLDRPRLAAAELMFLDRRLRFRYFRPNRNWAEDQTEQAALPPSYQAGHLVAL